MTRQPRLGCPPTWLGSRDAISNARSESRTTTSGVLRSCSVSKSSTGVAIVGIATVIGTLVAVGDRLFPADTISAPPGGAEAAMPTSPSTAPAAITPTSRIAAPTEPPPGPPKPIYDDLWYESCVGSIRQRSQAFIGTGPATQPTPSACASAAKTQPIGKLDVRHIKVGDALCIVTNNRQIAWAMVVRLGEPFHETLTDGRIPCIELVVTLWPAL